MGFEYGVRGIRVSEAPSLLGPEVYIYIYIYIDPLK